MRRVMGSMMVVVLIATAHPKTNEAAEAVVLPVVLDAHARQPAVVLERLDLVLAGEVHVHAGKLVRAADLTEGSAEAAHPERAFLARL